MAAPSYVTDLVTIDDGTGTFTEPTGATLGTIAANDTDNFVQGNSCNSKTTGASGAPALAGLGFQAASPQTIASPNAFYAWVFVGGGGLIDSYANGGIRLLIGNTSANYRYWYVDGNDFFPYIGWECIAIETDNAVVAATGSQGSPSSTKQDFGVIFNCKINIGKGNPMAVDAVRWGRTITVTLGDSGGYATFAGIAAYNDSINNRFGQFQGISGGYQLQGRLLFGVTGGNAVDSRDSNVSIVTAISRKVAASFNSIEIQNASSNIAWDAIVWSALGTVSRGTLIVTDNATVSITNSAFTNLSTFALLSNTVFTGNTMRGCDTVTGAGANLSGSKFLVPIVAADTSAVVWNVNTDTDGKFDGCTFSKGANAHHAIELGTSAPTSITLRNVNFSGFTNSVGDSAAPIHVKATEGTVTITVIGCTGISASGYKSAGATVNIVSSAVTATITVKNTAVPPVAIQSAMVNIIAAAGGPFPSDVTVTGISNSGTTATVTHNSHGMATNDKVQIAGASLWQNNGVFTITKINDNSYSYTMPSAPGSSPTGTIKATFVVLNGLTDSNGQVTMTRSFTSSQPFTGRVRKSTSAPYYKTADLIGTVDSDAGWTGTVQLVLDQ
jgi:hypothetical protein